MGTEALVNLVLGLFDAGVHQLDPARREAEVRRRVDEEVARWRAADPGELGPRADAVELAHLHGGRHHEDDGA